MMKTKMILAVFLPCIHSIPKLVLTLGKMCRIVTLGLQETLRLCIWFRNWTNKLKNYIKSPRCFYCSSPNPTTATHIDFRDECTNKNTLDCQHLLKCIEYKGLNMSEDSICFLNLFFCKAKRVAKRPNKTKISHM